MQAAETDSMLVVAAQEGDKAAFAILLDRYRSTLLALCRRMLADLLSAEDAAHESILQALLNLDRLERPDRFGAWLYGIGLNICRRRLRERTMECWSWEALAGGRYVPEPQDWRSCPEEQAELAELADRVRCSVEDLPDGQRAAVQLFYLSSLTYAETAVLLGIEVGAVKTRLHKARRTLRHTLWSTWRDETMATETKAEMVDMRVADVRRMVKEGGAAPAAGQSVYWIVLEETRGNRKLLIWVGQFEGTAIALLLNKAAPPRPQTFAFIGSALGALNARVCEARVTRLADEVFYAEVALEGPTGPITIDARPSDAIALALTVEAPIRAEESMLDSLQPGSASRAQVEAETSRATGETASDDTSQGAQEIAAEVISAGEKR